MSFMSRLRLLCMALLVAAIAPFASADEQINLFDVTIDVQTNGDVIVTERIEVTAEGRQIRRGIFRDLPDTYSFEDRVFRYSYDVESVMRDGRPETYVEETDGNAFRIRIGEADRFLEPDIYTYEIRYRVKNQIRYGDAQDEIYWNATGNYWAFPIMRARASVVLPDGARTTEYAAYTGYLGQSGDDYRHTRSGATHVFETTREMGAGEGLTVAVAMQKGVIDPPSLSDRTGMMWQRYGAMAILMLSAIGVGAVSYRNFDRVGRDPPKPPIYPIYEPPEGLSPAATNYVYHRGAGTHRALIATLMSLAVKGRLTIDATGDKTTVLERTNGGGEAEADTAIPVDDAALERSLFISGDRRELGGKYDAGFTRAYMKFRRAHMSKYGGKYFRWNIGYMLLTVFLSVIGLFLAVSQAVDWTWGHTALLAALAGVNLLFMYLMPAPTRLGQDVRTKIEGFKLYMDTAERLQLNASKVGDELPMMSKARYERFLPYAVALGVEEPWSKYFEKMLPQEAENYHPTWGHYSSYRSIGQTTKGIVDSISSGVSSSLPKSSGSSGSGGGGSSGGGGGGGGGGGW